MEEIQYVGLKELTDEEQDSLRKLCTEHYAKLQRIHAAQSFFVHVKVYEKAGARKKYALHLKVTLASNKIIESCKSHDWELHAALHKSFEEIEHQLQHKLHLS